MIPINELRIGNWVIHKPYGNKDGELKQIMGIVSGSQLHVVYFDKHTNESSVSHLLEPIPLTPEILIACGFEGRFIEIEETPFYFYSDDNSEVYLWCEMEGAKPYRHSKIDSVHQLQNLIFALTQKELNYKPITTSA